MMTTMFFTQIFRIHIATLLLTFTFAASTLNAQNFDKIEQRLGGIVADGELSLEQAGVMMRALHEFTQQRNHDSELMRHFEKLGVNHATLEHVHQALAEHGIQDPLQRHRAIEVLLRITQMMNAVDGEFEMPDEMRHHLIEEMKLSEPQAKLLFDLARRLDHESKTGQKQNSESDREATEKKIVQWIESIGEKLEKAVDSGDLSEENAWEKWHEFKAKEIEPKIEAAVKSRVLSEEQAEQIWVKIREREEAQRKSD